MTESGVYTGVHALACVPQRFIANASVGGRVMCANNKQSHTIRQCDIRVSAVGNLLRGLEDLDGISLNPSAMSCIPGCLLGAPKIWHPGVVLNDVDGYSLKIKITSVGKKYPFPRCRLKKDGGNL